MRKTNRPSQQAVRRELAVLTALPEEQIDLADIPEVRDWRGAQRGRFYRPVKQVVTIRLDADVIAWFKARDRKYQTAVNRALREYVIGHSRSSKSRPAVARKPKRRKLFRAQ